jgi:hypothetical protein
MGIVTFRALSMTGIVKNAKPLRGSLLSTGCPFHRHVELKLQFVEADHSSITFPKIFARDSEGGYCFNLT